MNILRTPVQNSMQIWLLRHAHAETDSQTGQDIDRPLSARGYGAARALNVHLRSNPLPGGCHVRISPALRARQTAAIVLADLGLFEPVPDPRIWDAPAGTLLEVVRNAAAESPVVMLVGHNPALEGLVRWLSGAERSMSPGSLVVLTAGGRLRPGTARIVSEYQPPVTDSR